MRLALRELRRQPGRFGAAAVILLLIAVLLMFLGGLVDGLIRNSTGAVRAQRADLIVFSADAQQSFVRSKITAETRAVVESTSDVREVGGIGVIQLGARLPGRGPRDLADIALFGYELAPAGVPDQPPADGEVYADETLRSFGAEKGMTIELGPFRSPVRIIGFVSDSNYLGQSSLWGSPATWRTVTRDNRSTEVLADDAFQSLLVRTDASRATARAIDANTDGATETLTRRAATNAIPGVKEQRSTFNQIIGITVAIAAVVVALFFALLTVERASLYGVLKAIGAGSGTLFAGVLVQAVVLTILAAGGGAILSVLLDALLQPGSIPFAISVSRIMSSTVSLLAAAAVGCVFSLRRVLRVDPARAIGGSP